MRTLDFQDVAEVICELYLESLFSLRKDIRFALEQALDNETEPARTYLELLLKNADVAKKEQLPLHHDTGIPMFFLEVGHDVHLEGGSWQQAIAEGVQIAHEQYPTKHQIVREPFEKMKSNLPPVAADVDVVEGDSVRLACWRLDASSERASHLLWMTLPLDQNKLKSEVQRVVLESGALASPPLLIGVGIAATSAQAGLQAKKALRRTVGKPHSVLEKARLEQSLLNAVNNLYLGPGGMGGMTTALAVHVKASPTHEDAVPIAVNLHTSNLRFSERVL
jgi:fumarate hydratase subunit alpha